MAARTGNGLESANDSSAAEELQVLDISPQDFENIEMRDLSEILEAQDSVAYSRFLQDSPPLSPLPTVVTELPRQNGSKTESNFFSSVAMSMDSRCTGSPKSKLIPLTVQEVADSPEVTSVKNEKALVATVRKLPLPKVGATRKGGPEKRSLIAKARKRKARKKSDTKLKQITLPDFLLSTLRSTRYNPSVLRWEESNKGIFKIMNGKRLAELWRASRQKKSSSKYEFFARAMRYYYKRGFIKRIKGRKLLYQFDDKSNWRRSVDRRQNVDTSGSHETSEKRRTDSSVENEQSVLSGKQEIQQLTQTEKPKIYQNIEREPQTEGIKPAATHSSYSTQVTHSGCCTRSDT